ncbi:MAG: hypothetical protein JSW02_08940 [candidate division WOR-3 bacterium]|nr:MAG: hypothetical protein JSW02_08940 [candidate division WOR-3 bacterium]
MKSIYCLRWMLLVMSVLCCSMKSGDIALYSGRGADDDCITATRAMLESFGFRVDLIGPNDINSATLENFRMICFPGGDMYQYTRDISSSGKDQLRAFISDGGAYIGICGGAYFTGEEIYWQGTQLPAAGLGIFPGNTSGPLDEIAPYPYCVMCKIGMTDTLHPITHAEPDTAWIVYCYGPTFEPHSGSDIDILGVYHINQKPAMVAFSYGSGRVFVIGPHPEFEEDDDRDGVDFCESFDDRGSDWDIMENAVMWCLGEQ